MPRSRSGRTFVINRLGPVLTAFAARTSGENDPVRFLGGEERGKVLDGGIFEGEDVRLCADGFDFFVTGCGDSNSAVREIRGSWMEEGTYCESFRTTEITLFPCLTADEANLSATCDGISTPVKI